MSQPYLDGSFLAALERGSWEKAFSLIAQGAHARIENDLALRRAAMTNRVKEAATLLSMGADPRAQNHQAMRHACRLGYVDMARLLIESGADLDEPEGEPLRLAVEYRNPLVVRLLIDQGADVPSSGAPALWQAVKMGDGEIEGLLIKAGARLHVVACEADSDTLERLVRAGASTQGVPEAQAIAERIALEETLFSMTPGSVVRPTISRGLG